MFEELYWYNHNIKNEIRSLQYGKRIVVYTPLLYGKYIYYLLTKREIRTNEISDLRTERASSVCRGPVKKTICHLYRIEVYIGFDINGPPYQTKCPTNPKTTRYPNGENRTTRTRPDSELPYPNPTGHELSNYISWPITRILPGQYFYFTIWTLES